MLRFFNVLLTLGLITVVTSSLTAQRITYNPTLPDPGKCNGGLSIHVEGEDGPFIIDVTYTGGAEYKRDAYSVILNNQCPYTFYTIKVKNQEGCEIIETYALGTCDLKSNGKLSMSCDDSYEPAIRLHPTGGSPPYYYNWSNGSTSSTIDNLRLSNYSVTVTDDNGCRVSENFTIQEPSSFFVNLTVFPSRDNVKGLVSVQVYNPYPPYRVFLLNEWYDIEESGGIIEKQFSSSDISGSSTSLESFIWISNDVGCIYTENFSIYGCSDNTQDPFEVVLNEYFPVLECVGEGAISINKITGGIPPYDIEINLINSSDGQVGNLYRNSIYQEVIGDNLDIDGLTPGRVEIIVSDQCNNVKRMVRDLCDYCGFTYDSGDDTYTYGTKREGGNGFIEFEVACSCIDQCGTIFTPREEKIEWSINSSDNGNLNYNRDHSPWIITWPDGVTTTTITKNNGNGFQVTGHIGDFSFGESLDNISEPLIKYINISRADGCEVAIPVEFKPEQRNRLGLKKFDFYWDPADRLKDFDDKYGISYVCSSCSPYLDDVVTNDSNCESEVEVLKFYPNNKLNPCYGGGRLVTYRYNNNQEVILGEINVPENTAIDQVTSGLLGNFFFSSGNQKCTNGGACLFDALDIYGVPLDDDVIAFYCFDSEQFNDKDMDGVNDESDNCIDVYNPFQDDSDNDGIGDKCEDMPDDDNDGIPNDVDVCPDDPTNTCDPGSGDGGGDGESCEIIEHERDNGCDIEVRCYFDDGTYEIVEIKDSDSVMPCRFYRMVDDERVCVGVKAFCTADDCSVEILESTGTEWYDIYDCDDMWIPDCATVLSNPNYGGCLNAATENIVTRQEEKQEFIISPNPTRNGFYLTFHNNNYLSGKMMVYNSVGVKYSELNVIDQSRIFVNTLEYPNGVYFVLFSTIEGERLPTKKVIVVK